MAEGFRILEHPADLGIEAWSDSLGGTMRQAVKALASVIVDPSTVNPTGSRPVALQADDSEQLLVRLLSEVLFCLDAEHFVTVDLVVNDVTGTDLHASFRGELLRPAKHHLKLDVKAITYHQLSISQEQKTITARIFVDI